MQNSLAGEIERSLMPDYEFHPQSFEVAFDRSRVDALQDDQNDLFNRATIGVTGGWLTVAAAKQMVGLKPDPEGDCYIRDPSKVVEVPKGLTVYDIQIENQLLLTAERKVRRIAG